MSQRWCSPSNFLEPLRKQDMGAEEWTLDASKEGIHLEYESNEDFYIFFYAFYDSSVVFFFFSKKCYRSTQLFKTDLKKGSSPEDGTSMPITLTLERLSRWTVWAAWASKVLKIKQKQKIIKIPTPSYSMRHRELNYPWSKLPSMQTRAGGKRAVT